MCVAVRYTPASEGEGRPAMRAAIRNARIVRKDGEVLIVDPDSGVEIAGGLT